MRSLDPARRMTRIRRAFLLCGLALFASAVLAQSKGNPERGAVRAAPCLACHGSPEREPLPGTPALAGQLEDFLVLQMVLLREGLRDAPLMEGTLKGLSDPDLFDIAAYFFAQKPLQNRAKVNPELRAQGARLSTAMGCGSCHLKDYRGQKQVPRLTGQREDYLAATMKAYRDNKRTGTDTSMNGILYRVPDADIEALAHYLAHQ
jgi:cytochrome c553